MKKYATLLMIVALVVGLLSACGSKSENGTKTVSIITPYLSSVTTNQMVESLKKLASDKSWKTNVIDTAGDISQMASRLEDAITSKVDAIVIVSSDPSQLTSQIQDAKSKNIPVFGVDSGYVDGMAMNATSDNAQMSQLITDYLLGEMGNKGNLVVLTHRPHPGVLARTEKLDQILAENKDIKLVTEQQVDVPGPIENARKQMENILLSNSAPGAVTAVWAGWDEAAIGAAQAIEEAGRSDIIVTGIDGNSQAIEMIDRNSPLKATVEQNFIGMTEIVVKQIERVFNGEQVEATEMYAPASLIKK
ncbi:MULTISPECIES: sugar ABC transporter substrate-binding protein [unclassified Paenibacillus]|uniref:sugar ABC transporter substrate-binding protein n=1 Tax=unclassified Paenibacillus TaxID=185978 RepID=UPI002F3EB02C